MICKKSGNERMRWLFIGKFFFFFLGKIAKNLHNGHFYRWVAKFAKNFQRLFLQPLGSSVQKKLQKILPNSYLKKTVSSPTESYWRLELPWLKHGPSQDLPGTAQASVQLAAQPNWPPNNHIGIYLIIVRKKLRVHLFT